MGEYRKVCRKRPYVLHLTGAQLEGIVREATLVALRENIDNKQVAQRHFEAALMAIF